MPTVTLEEAQARLRDLIHNLLQGEELVITDSTVVFWPVRDERSSRHDRLLLGE